MVVDSSVLVAIIQGEPDAGLLEWKLAASERTYFSAANWIETSNVIVGKSVPDAFARVDQLLRDLAIEIVPVSQEDARIARDGLLLYGKGRHKAALNLGDCFAYALAKRLEEPLLFKGIDFIHTDIQAA